MLTSRSLASPFNTFSARVLILYASVIVIFPSPSVSPFSVVCVFSCSAYDLVAIAVKAAVLKSVEAITVTSNLLVPLFIMIRNPPFVFSINLIYHLANLVHILSQIYIKFNIFIFIFYHIFNLHRFLLLLFISRKKGPHCRVLIA